MHLNAKLIYPQIVHFKFDCQYSLASTFMRIQEFYESEFENIKGKPFTLFDYMDTHVRYYGKFDYFTKWVGFNFPSHTLKEFLKCQEVIYMKEATRFTYVKSLVDWDKPFYVIGTYGHSSALDHELAHAFYHISPDYKKKMDLLRLEIPSKYLDKILHMLKDYGYHWEVRNDEIQAYMATETSCLNYMPLTLIDKYKEIFHSEKLNQSKLTI